MQDCSPFNVGIHGRKKIQIPPGTHDLKCRSYIVYVQCHIIGEEPLQTIKQKRKPSDLFQNLLRVRSKPG